MVGAGQDRTEELGRAIIAGAADVAAAMAAWLALVAEFDREEAWRAWECTSCVQWLSWKCGMAESTARQHVFVARALEGLPVVTAAFRRGELTYCKVRALVRFVTPDTEEELVDLARVATGRQLATIARGYRRATRDPERARPHRVDIDWDDDGDLVIRAKVPTDVGLTVLRSMAVAARVVEGEDERGSDGSTDPDPGPEAVEGRRHAGMVAALEAVAHLALAGAGDVAASPPPPDLVVTVTPEDLRTSEDGPDEPLPGRRGLSREVVRRLGCDGTTATLLHDRRGNPIDLGRRRRTVNPAQQTALHLRADGRCEFPGCGHRRFLHAHHVVHWADGGPTDLDNLVLLCSFHHRALHEGGFAVRIEADRTRSFVGPKGSVWHDRSDLADPSRRRRVPAASGSVEPQWGGERLDLGHAIDAILSLERMGERRRERDAAASRVPVAA